MLQNETSENTDPTAFKKPPDFTYTQIRIARPTASLEKIKEFYISGLGLTQVGSFTEHEGISGIMLGMPDATYHLEFTQHGEDVPCPPPGNDNLLVFYLSDTEGRNTVAQRLFDMGYPLVEPANPYWKKHGLTIEDPDKWRIVLMDIAGFNDRRDK